MEACSYAHYSNSRIGLSQSYILLKNMLKSVGLSMIHINQPDELAQFLKDSKNSWWKFMDQIMVVWFLLIVFFFNFIWAFSYSILDFWIGFKKNILKNRNQWKRKNNKIIIDILDIHWINFLRFLAFSKKKYSQ